jgi:cation:H+ antiporter
MVFTFIEMALLLVLIVTCCSFFTNAIEWTGHRFNLSEGAVGSVLAAVGTALPETLVPIIAILSGFFGLSGMNQQSGQEIGTGAILGAPFLLGTLAMFVSASAVYCFTALKRRTLNLTLNKDLFRRDLQYFFPAYVMVLAAAFIHVPYFKQGLAIALLVFYGVYVYRTINKNHEPGDDVELEKLFFAPRSENPPTVLIMLQVLASLLGLLILVHFFVEQISHAAVHMRMPSLILSLIITPIATEMPEKFNSVVWIGQGKDSLAWGNITGAMVFQSCIPTAIGLFGTPWILDSTALTSVALCLTASILIYLVSWKCPKFLLPAMMSGGAFYLFFLYKALVQ